jgi:hypothetical protein
MREALYRLEFQHGEGNRLNALAHGNALMHQLVQS